MARIPRWDRGSRAGAKNAHICQSTIGSASAKPAAKLTLSEVMNGSATPNVTSWRWSRRERQDQPARRSAGGTTNATIVAASDGSARDDQPRAELLEVVDEHGLLAVGEPVGKRASLRGLVLDRGRAISAT